ncbi:FAD binding domain-containing protein [Piscinibacter sakaiensis]|uniref:Carbon monoxide dehydrogenase, medium chain n=1 Tax=Piscinibacter sakaiensis TaxID=1547922 RepID=A0A0K8P544_PISS1|nr:xanthine dehydrogenase family protein subunit M [Piscinibacter sakaiensis]GAP37686.1 carbon monoxide dehydrogenase, medium chain [Piscinibacter sakaiensis]
MKAPAFDHVKPDSLDEVLRLLQAHGDRARLLAGGQTLLATLNMRLSEPALLIDLNGLEALRGLQRVGDRLRIGALCTHAQIEASPLVAELAPLLSLAAPHIAHRAIRNRGTFGGSIAYGDPAAEWPACLLALEGEVLLRGPRGERRVAARDFFTDLYTTQRADDEVLVACELPIRRPGEQVVFDELARRHGDYAIVGLALAAELHGGRIARPRLALLGVGSVPVRAPAAEAVLDGRVLDEALVATAVAALRAELQPHADLVNSAATKRHLAGVLAQRALRRLPELAAQAAAA